jgi:hypothetical protein
LAHVAGGRLDARKYFGYSVSLEARAMRKRSMYEVRMELFRATPSPVWREYFDNGYTWAKAVNEELSYAETENE